jgi:Flp pilus assembly pilin Flp
MLGFKRKKGQGMTEYIIIVGLIALSAIVIVSLFGQQIKAGFASMTRSISGQASAVKTTAVTAANTDENSRGNLSQYKN